MIAPATVVSLRRRLGFLPIALAAIMLLLGGCLVATNPFYDAKDTIQDDRIVGLYPNDDTQSVWEVTKSNATRGQYRLVLDERGTQSEYTGTSSKPAPPRFSMS